MGNMHVEVFSEDGTPEDESLDPRVKKVIDRIGLSRAEDLQKYTYDYLIANFSVRSVMAVHEALQRKGLKLKGD